LQRLQKDCTLSTDSQACNISEFILRVFCTQIFFTQLTIISPEVGLIVKRIMLISLALDLIILASIFVAIRPSMPEATQSHKPFYVGIEFGYGDASECRKLVDKVKNYTNLIAIANTDITTNETLLNDTCDYIYNAGVHIVVYFPDHQSFSSSQNTFSVWTMKAKDKYGDYFLGTYIYDEVAGRVLDHDPGCISINYVSSQVSSSYSAALDYKVAASNFISNAQDQMADDLYLAKKAGTSVMTADYGLYWFDYKAGYDTVLAEFGWGNNHQLAIALCRGAATAQGKSWGAIICWELYTKGVGAIEDGPALYDDLVLAYDNGAKYAVIFNYAGNNQQNPYDCGIMNEEHFEALENFWTYTLEHPEKHGSLAADTALVLPEAYGFGFRSEIDNIWGLGVSDPWKTKVWADANSLLSQHGSSLDIVYSDSEFEDVVDKAYPTVIRWSTGATVEDYPVVNLNKSMGYQTIQEAISSMTTFSGDTVFVKSGIYRENLLINKAVLLLGENEKNTIIDGGNTGSAVCFMGVSGASLSGFTVKNGNLFQNATLPLNGTAALTQLLQQYGLGSMDVSQLNSTMISQLMSILSQLPQQSTATKLSAGIYLYNANNCTIKANIIVNSTCGILLSSSKNNTLTGNSLKGNVYGFGVSATTPQQYINYVDTSNLVNGKPVYYWIDKSNLTVPSDAGSVALINCINMTVQNLTLSDNYNGLLLINTRESNIIGNVISRNYEGMIIQNSSNNVLKGNRINENTLNLRYENNTYPNEIDASNTVNGKPVYIWYNQKDRIVPSDAGYVALIECNGITVQNLTFGNGQGILLQNTRNSTIAQNNLKDLDCGILLSNSSNNIIIQNNITASQKGILITNSSANTISGNIVNNCSEAGIAISASKDNNLQDNRLLNANQGLLIQDSSFNTVKGNSFISNSYGLQFKITGPQTVQGNNVTGNSCTGNSVIENLFQHNEYGIQATTGVLGNTFYHNNFNENNRQAYSSYSSGISNAWDNGKEGNYWSNYNGTDTNRDGIGDQPISVYESNYPDRYPTNSNDQDRFPLMAPFTN
jgi:parallel beta-helix repeat protein